MKTPQLWLRKSNKPSGRQCGNRKPAGKCAALTAVALLSIATQASAQNPLFTLTGGSTSATTQPAASFAGNWYQTASAVAPSITSANALVSALTGPFAYGNASATIIPSPGSGGNKIVLPGNAALSSFSMGNINLASVASPVLSFNLILLGGNGNPTFTVKFSGSFGTSVLSVPALATNVWTAVQLPIPAQVLGATGPVSLTFERSGNTNGANGAHFWAFDDVAITPGTPAPAPCPVVAANTYSWHGAGSGSGSTNSDFNNLANWCPQPATASTLAAANLQFALNSTATITLDANFTAASMELSVAGNNTDFVLDLNGHSLTVAGNLSANVASGNTDTDLEIRTGTGLLTVNGSTQLGTASTTGKVGFSAAPNAGTLTFNGPVTFGTATGMFATAPKTVNFKSTITNNSAQLAAGGFAGSTVNLSGATAQTISGTQDIAFQNLTVNNVQGVTTNAVNLLVPGTLTMTAGTLTTGGQTKVKLGTTGTISEKADSYVIGYLEVLDRQISATPQHFGNIGAVISAAAGSYSTNILRVTSLFNFTIQHGNSQNYVEKHTIKRKYQISVANAPADLDASLTLNYWSHEMAGIPTEEFGFFRENPNAPGTWTSRGRDANALNLPIGNMPGSITLSNIAAFSTWSAGGGSTPLPVELMWFTAKNDQNTALLEWATVTERNNAGYEIEASNDNVNFETIGFIDAVANRNQNTEYSFSEPQQPSRRGLRYYRLIQHDLNGTKTILGVRTVSFEARGCSVITSPNPFSYGFTALIESDMAQTAHVTLIDALGRIVAQQEAKLEKGVNQIDLDGYQLSRGMYVLRVKLDKEIMTTQVQKQ